ncbi:MAG: class I SAM-dependent methyltransferase [bacterium]
MPYDFHLDPVKKWDQQYLVTRDHIIPFIQEVYPLPEHAKVLEVGCGEGGVLKAFSEKGYTCYGVDIAAHRIEHARRILQKEVEQRRITFYAADVHDTRVFEHLMGEIDVLILKDAIEHIHDQARILSVLHKFVKQGGVVFVAFPPWWNPFGGHQQLAESFLKVVPWVHLLPQKLYRGLLKVCGESEDKIAGLMEIYDTRLSIHRFERLLQETAWQVLKRQFFLFNPIYQYKFGIKGRKQFDWVSGLPFVRDFVSTAVYYLIHA